MNINDLFFKKVEVKDVIEYNTIIKTWIDEQSEHFVKDWASLESCIEGVYSGYYEDNLSQLSEMWYRLVKNHPFSNGNKRTALFTIKFTIFYNIFLNYKKIETICFDPKNFEIDYILKRVINYWENDYLLSLEIASSRPEDKALIIKKIEQNIENTFEIIVDNKGK